MGLVPGTVFEGRYRIEMKIGQGGFAGVYLAHHVDINRRVAIKVLSRENAQPRFIREGQILAALKSPYTVRILDFGRTDDGQAYIVSELVDGEPLHATILRGPMPWAEVEPIIRQVLMSLAEAHDAGIVHRDIKPANIMRLRDGAVRVLDFGVAKAEMIADDTLTQSGVVVGTPRYMAPESLLGSRHAKPAVDVFAVGLVAFALLIGGQPVPGRSTDEILASLLAPAPLRLPREVDVPMSIRRWVEHLIEKDPAGRPADAKKALELLDEAVAAASSHNEADTFEKFAVLPALAAIVVIAIGASLIAWAYSGVDFSHKRTTHAAPAKPKVVVAHKPAEAVVNLEDEYTAGRVMLKARDWVGALREFRKIEDHPMTVEAKMLAESQSVRIAIEEVLDQAPSEATVKDLEAILEMYPEDRRTKARLHEVREKLASPPPAAPTARPTPREKVKRGLGLSPKQPSDATDKGNALYVVAANSLAEGRNEEAIRTTREAMENGCTTKCYKLMAQAYYRQRNDLQACQWFRRAKTPAPSDLRCVSTDSAP